MTPTAPPPFAVQTFEVQTFEAQTPEQARLLLDLSYFKALERVMQGETSAGEVARAAGLTVKQAHHRLTRLVEVGLVTVCGERKRGGRPVKLYRGRGEGYRVPFGLTDAATLGELIGSMHRPFMTAFNQAVADEFLRLNGENGDVFLRTDGEGHLSAKVGPVRRRDEAPQAYGTFSQLHLGPEARQEFARRLRDLHAWAEAQERAEPGEEPCIIGLILTPGRVPGL